MSENGDISNPIPDQNPNQAFKGIGQTPSPLVSDENPNEYFKQNTERPLEPYTMWFGDVITFDDKKNPDAKRSVILDVKTGPEFTVSHISKTPEGKDMITIGAVSTHGVEQLFYKLGKWTPDQVKTAIENYFETEKDSILISENDTEAEKIMKQRRQALLEKLKAQQLGYVDKWAQNQSRTVTVDDIKAGRQNAKKL